MRIRFVVSMSMLDSAISPARQARRHHIVEAAKALIGTTVGTDFDPVRAPICAIDVVMVAGSPWLKDGLERDFAKDESGYRKLGGSANTPEQAYFFRAPINLIHHLKRAGFYVPRGSETPPVRGMACFFEWEDRGRYNFAPDRAGIVTDVRGGHVSSVVIPVPADPRDKAAGYTVRAVRVHAGDVVDQALIGYSDLP